MRRRDNGGEIRGLIGKGTSFSSHITYTEDDMKQESGSYIKSKTNQKNQLEKRVSIL